MIITGRSHRDQRVVRPALQCRHHSRRRWARRHRRGVAATVAFRASGEASCINGQDLLIDGGLTSTPGMRPKGEVGIFK